MSKIPSTKIKPKASPRHSRTKTDQVIGLLRRPSGASLADLMKSTGWQAHSVRGFLSGTLVKRRGLNVSSEVIDGARRYRLAQPDATP
jgi:hypothetical protein